MFYLYYAIYIAYLLKYTIVVFLLTTTTFTFLLLLRNVPQECSMEEQKGHGERVGQHRPSYHCRYLSTDSLSGQHATVYTNCIGHFYMDCAYTLICTSYIL